MSPRRTILRELSARHQQGETRYTRPASIRGFSEKPDRFQSAVNQLLSERLINGTKDEEGRLAIALNPHRVADVNRELRPWYARPVSWLAAIAVVMMLAAGFVL